jgi:HlyD family secretion protein
MESRRKKVILILTLVLIGAVSVFVYVRYHADRNPNELKLSGNIELTDVQVSFKIAGWVEKREVDEGMMVKTGNVVARLDTSDLVEQVRIRESELETARATLAELEAGSRPQEIAEAKAAVDVARAEVLDAKSNFDRISPLWNKKIAGYQEYISAQAAYDAAVARLAQAKERYSLVKEGPRKEVIDQARGKLHEAQSALDLARVQLGYATLLSPISGVVLSENIESGEFVQPGTPVVTIGDIENVWLRVYINETDLGRVKLGQKAKIVTDTYPGKFYEGRVSFISSEAEFTPKNVQTQEERVKLVYRMKIDIHNPEMELKPGMPADAWISLNQK